MNTKISIIVACTALNAICGQEPTAQKVYAELDELRLAAPSHNGSILARLERMLQVANDANALTQDTVTTPATEEPKAALRRELAWAICLAAVIGTCFWVCIYLRRTKIHSANTKIQQVLRS